MKGILIIVSALFSTGLFAGGVTGGWGKTDPHVVIGDSVINPEEVQVNQDGTISLERERLLQIMTGSMRHQKLIINNEELAPVRFDFGRNELHLRRLKDPYCRRFVVRERQSKK